MDTEPAEPESRTANPKEQAVIRGFTAILRHVCAHGLTDEVAVVETWLEHVRDPRMRGEMARLLGFYWLRRDDPAKAVRYSDMASALLPDNTDSVINAMSALLRTGQWAEVVPRARAALARFGERQHWHHFLCAAHGRLGQLAEARYHGTRCLELKDIAVVAPAADLSNVPVPAFDATRPERNAISFSLSGDNEQAIRMAILNARAARFLYLGWTCHYYIDESVPGPVVQALGGEGARVLMVRGLPADPFSTFWRFLVADDPGVDRYLVRGATALLNVREYVAVQEWLRSGHHFHVMRDHLDHAELILPGLWGGVRGALGPVGARMRQRPAVHTDLLSQSPDQLFLRDHLWTTIRASLLTHDSHFALGTSRDFPAVGHLPNGYHLGCDGRLMLSLKPASPLSP